ncbi:proprotein convertase subtilisin/kexin type 5-like [Mya arenaria]|uniref:proprotein convertase subtilisin/kexin type 5-like n=1 Tax=Mya arenaria TaxID=6604 RepID=UPI0022E2910C|nr:proprotein convertase subtilisin/kexin type 5-like [Mya arenaria]
MESRLYWIIKLSFCVLPLCATQCPDHKPFASDAGCVSKCPEPFYIRNKTCVFDCGEDFVDEARECIPSCPDGYPYQETLKTFGKEVFIEKMCIYNCYNGEVIFNNECLVRCPSSQMYLDIKDTHHRCVSKCPADKQFLLNNTNIYYSQCIRECESFISDGYCVTNCPIKMVHLNKKCMDSCPDSHTIVSNGQCFQECNDHSILSACKCPEDRPYLENKTCVTNCSELVQIKKYLAGKEEEYECVNECNQELVVYNKTCVDKCPADMPLLMNRTCVKVCPPDQNIIVVVTPRLTCNITEPECGWIPEADFFEYLFCKDSCPENEFIFNQTCVKFCSHPLIAWNRSCFTTCPASVPLLQSGGITVQYHKWVKEKGKMGSVYGKSGFSFYTTEIKADTCADTCVDQTFYFNGSCLPSCPSEANHVLEGKCVGCAKFTLNGDLYAQCVDECPTKFINDKVCVDKCPEDKAHAIHNKCSKCPIEKPFELNNKCVKNCREEGALADYSCENCEDSVSVKCINVQACNETVMINYDGRCLKYCPDGYLFIDFLWIRCYKKKTSIIILVTSLLLSFVVGICYRKLIQKYMYFMYACFSIPAEIKNADIPFEEQQVIGIKVFETRL